MKQDSPLVSVIIPLYNTEEYIAEALQSCLNQTYANLEIVVVDDGSKDSSVQIVSDFKQRDHRIQLICNSENKGTFATRIKGIESCNGDFILFLDSDDYLLPQACEQLLKAFVNKTIDFVACGYIEERKGAICHEYADYLHAGLGTQMYKMYKRELLLQACALCLEILGEYPKHLINLEDFLFSIFVMYFVKDFGQVAACLYFYRNNASSITREKSEHFFNGAALCLELIEKVINHPLCQYHQGLYECVCLRVKREKYDFYIYQRFAKNMIFLSGHTPHALSAFIPIYLQATARAASFGNFSRCLSRMLTFIVTLGLIKR